MLKAKMDRMFRTQEGKPDELIYTVSYTHLTLPTIYSV